MERALATSGRKSGPDFPVRRPIRLLIVDDSIVARAVLSRMVESAGGFHVAAVAATAEHALDALKSTPVDVILLDLEMPGTGGLDALPRIIAGANGAPVLIVSTLTIDGAEQTLAALSLGAADTLPKPGSGQFNGKFSEILLTKLHALADLPRPTAAPSAPAVVPMAPIRAMAVQRAGIVAIGSSTGGIHALGQLFTSLPPKIGVPILVTQHLPGPFMPVFARQLTISAGRETLVGEPGMFLEPDRIVLAPGDGHLLVRKRGSRFQIEIDRRKSSSGCMPSADPMFESMAEAFGAAGLGIVLSGIGRDGFEGAAKLVAAGGSVIAQDEASSAVWGMPRAIAENGLACAILNPGDIARRIASSTGVAPCR